ncbi:methyltransferase [Ktedonospora formicarum]|uniref:SAM-dependent methyltransferase n=1 Tax=Ktedonospora formicarum TaxID=2778364 RepID=A0A8J3I6K1_9CHLR|nr:methyltransferase [Ktedonospora formicarum]GHO47805.1 SAM-dependent methyltransferase [Ktedonospora formicarum]
MTMPNTVTADAIFQIASGFMASKQLFAASELGLFEHLADGPMTLKLLAQRIGIPCHHVRIIADAMVALGLVERHHHQYQNSPVAAAFLSGHSTPDLRPYLRLWNQISYPAWQQLEMRLRPDHIPSELVNEKKVKVFSEGVEAITSGAAQALPRTYDFRRHRRVLDLGGGTGSFLLALLQQQPAIEATLFDLPPIARFARQRLRMAPGAEQITVVEGDFFHDPLPPDQDCVLIAHVAHMFSPERNRALLQRLRVSVAAGTRLLLVDFWTDSTHTCPLFAALLAGEFLVATGEGDVYSEEEVRTWLVQSGWHYLEHQPLREASSLIVAEAHQ